MWVKHTFQWHPVTANSLPQIPVLQKMNLQAIRRQSPRLVFMNGDHKQAKHPKI